MMQCDLHLDALYDTTDYTLRVDYAALAGGRVTTRARLDVTRRIPLRHGGTLPMTTGSLILHGTPQQMWDIGMMLVKGAEVYLDKKTACREAAITIDTPMVARVTDEGKEEHR